MSEAMATAGNDADDGSEKGGATDHQAPEYALRLCITGMTRRSQQALMNIKHICDSYLKGRYHLEVIICINSRNWPLSFKSLRLPPCYEINRCHCGD